MPNYPNALRRSFTAKLQLFLAEGTRDMSLYSATFPARIDGRVSFESNGVLYGVVPVEERQPLTEAGVNILYLDEVDLSSGRTRQKRYLLTVVIRTVKPILEGERPTSAANKLREVDQMVLEALSDQSVELWDYSTVTPTDLNELGYWQTPLHNTPYRFSDESDAVPGGDIRHALTLAIEYTDKSF